MDKNFIKVDDLVRQRLGGGEERERSGAWLNMRDLLDKEMPQEERRIGIFYWRRLFSVVAALSLVGTVAVGSYEFSNAFRNRNVAELGEPGIEAVNNEPTANYVANGTETVVRDEQRVAGRVNGRMSGGLPEKPRHTASASTTNAGTEATLNSVSGTVGADGTTTGTITIDGNTHRGADVKRNTSKTYSVKKEVVTKGGALASKDHTGSSESTESRLTATASKAANTVEKTTASQNVVAANNPATDNKVAAGNAAAHTETSNASGNIATVASKTDLTSAGAAGKKSTGTVSKTAGRIGNGKTTHVASGSQNADLKNGNPVLSSGVASNSVAAGGKKEQSGRSAINALPTVGRGVTTANIPAAGVPAPMPAVTAAEASGAAQKAPVVAPSAQSVEANVPKDESSVAINDAAAVRNDPPLKDARSEANNSQGKKVITKLLVHTRNIKIAENEYAVKEDTISMEKVNMDLGLAGTQPAPSSTDMSATVSGKRASKRAMAGRGRSAVTTTGSAATNTSAGVSGVNTTGGAAGKSGAGKQGSSQSAANGIADEENELAVAGTSASGSEDGAANAVNQAIVPASAATEVSKETEVAKSKSAAKQGAGASLVQKMLSAFNDIKQNASRTQFVPGITAGINANFFGPSSFKGFQFGLTGDIIFNEKWNIMTEFKYFHRLNNSTQIDDNFYTYTQVGSQYRKDLQLNSYSFSALHSLELPVSVRYHQGKFDFYAGGNFLYTFSINTGAATQPAVGVAPEFVSAPGNDNSPTLNEADFSSRFGLGYLFGFSYQVAPKFNIDIRNVQTVWDNAASTGARSISNQLYKTPSLQLSIMYRLGGNRNKD
jgi:hypothetical protein